MKRRASLARVISDKTLAKGINKSLSQEVAAYLLDKKMVKDLSSLLRDVQQDWAAKGYIDVTATSAHDLDVSIIKDIEMLLKSIYKEAKTIYINQVYDPELVGGVRLTTADIQYPVVF